MKRKQATKTLDFYQSGTKPAGSVLRGMEKSYPVAQPPGEGKVNKLAYGTQELADLLSISTRSLSRLEQRGILKPSRALRKKLYSAKAVEAFLKETS